MFTSRPLVELKSAVGSESPQEIVGVFVEATLCHL